MTGVPAYFRDAQARVDRALEQATEGRFDGPPIVRDAMRYTLLAPSKRVRAILTEVACDLCGGGNAPAAGAAIEMIHAASLILDDLPSMDDAPLRRGRPSCPSR